MSTTTDLTLTRREIIDGMYQEYEGFADLVSSLGDGDWDTPSRCQGWAVRDVAGHVIGLAEDVAAGTPGARTAEEEAASVRGDAPAVAAGRLREALTAIARLAEVLDDDGVWVGPSGVAGMTMGEGVLLLWYDVYLHADDIRTAVGRPTERGPGERAAVNYLAQQLPTRDAGPARFVLTDGDHPPLHLGAAADADLDAVPVHRLGTHEFILVATGRLDAAGFGLDRAVNIYAGVSPAEPSGMFIGGSCLVAADVINRSDRPAMLGTPRERGDGRAARGRPRFPQVDAFPQVDSTRTSR